MTNSPQDAFWYAVEWEERAAKGKAGRRGGKGKGKRKAPGVKEKKGGNKGAGRAVQEEHPSVCVDLEDYLGFEIVEQ